MLRLSSLLLFLLLQFSLSAQDSIHLQWKAVPEAMASGTVKIKYSAAITPGWHVYAKPVDAEGLSGLQLQYADSSLRSGPIEWVSEFSLIKDPVFENHEVPVIRDSIIFYQELKAGKMPSVIQVLLTADVADASNFLQEEKRMTVLLSPEPELKAINKLILDSVKLDAPLSNCSTSGAVAAGHAGGGLMYLFWLGFIGGLVALLTPCVFPMIPLTVSFFTKRSGSRGKGIRNAVLYGFFIFLIYVILSLPFHFLDSVAPEILNNISTNVYLNVFFFIVFVVFAFSFFGYYEITLPASLTSKTDRKADTGNILGIFFMALTLALVSFSCTGPILGSLLAGSLSGDGGAMQLTAGMAGFGFALALPFAIFALFPNWLHNLPRSGGWLNTVKVVLGFVELALALKFLSNADLVKHWGILKREIFIGIWILIGLLLSAYLLGWIRFRHDDAKVKWSAPRIIMAVISLAFTLYLVPGVTQSDKANLKLISGFPPPLYYSIYSTRSECVLGLNCTHDYREALTMARQENKPILIDFTGYACVNCRRMEEKVWSRPDVYKVMKENYIVVSLYVDDKKSLPPAEQFNYVTRDGMEKFIRTIGDKWSTFETENFANNSQPWYVILDTKERLLTTPVGYTDSEEEYLNWLQCGLRTFRENK
jgi:thiol:disulfide interchange protein DsbD